MRIIVTGGSGHLGNEVVEVARARGHDVFIIDMAAPRDPAMAQHRWYAGSVQEEAAAAYVTEKLGFVPGAVIHLAGILGTEELFDRPFDAVDINIGGTLRMLEGCRGAGGRYVGVETGTPWKSPYSITKRAAREFAEGWAMRYAVLTTTLRVFNLYGPGPSLPSKVVPMFIQAALRDEPIPVIGTGGQSLDLVWAPSVALAFVRAAESAPGRGEVIDIGSGRSRTVLEFAQMVARAAKAKANILHMPERKAEGPEHPVADTAAARELLDWESYDDDDEVFAERLKDTVAWYRGVQ